jgi:glycosyltransferase involved in cell wall biosynthesis
MIKIDGFSVGIPTFNGLKFIEGCLESILSQPYVPETVIISDDGSSDDTIQFCRDYFSKNNLNLKIFRNEKGPDIGSNYNNLIDKCETRWLQILDQDDYLLSNSYTDNFAATLLNNVDSILLLRMETNFRLVNSLSRAFWYVFSFSPNRTVPSFIPILGTFGTRSGVIYPMFALKKERFDDPYVPGCDVIHFHKLRKILSLSLLQEGGVFYALRKGAFSSNHEVSVRPEGFFYRLDFYLRKFVTSKIRKFL